MVNETDKAIHDIIKNFNEKLKEYNFFLEETDDVCEDFEREWLIVSNDKEINEIFSNQYAAVRFAYENDEYDVSLIEINPRDDADGSGILYEDTHENNVISWINDNTDFIITKIVEFYNNTINEYNSTNNKKDVLDPFYTKTIVEHSYYFNKPSFESFQKFLKYYSANYKKIARNIDSFIESIEKDENYLFYFINNYLFNIPLNKDDFNKIKCLFSDDDMQAIINMNNAIFKFCM